VINYRNSKLGGTNARPAADPIQPSDPDFTRLFRADAAEPQPQAAPPVANDDSYSTSDDGVLSGNVLTNDTAGDVPLQVTAVNGSALAVDHEIVLASGARLRLNADGSFTYNPNGAFDAVTTTEDAFSYTVAGGDTATVTVTVFDPSITHLGTDNPETLNGTPNDDVMDARGGDDIVNGLGGNDSIDGGTGADQMNGSTGNDTYFVDNAGDTVTELAGEGYDIIIANVNYTLGAGVYVEELVAPTASTTGYTLIGNELDNIIRGSRGVDTLRGMAGNDVLDRGSITKGGLNTLVGGTGDDIYIAGSFGGISDVCFDAAGEGYDIVYVVRGDFFELGVGTHIELIAPLATLNLQFVNIAGSGTDNEMRGTQGGDTLNGKAGNDTMIGYGGNDSYNIDQVGDVVVEEANGGNDTITTSLSTFTLSETGNVENLIGGRNIDNSLSTSPVSLAGNSVANRIEGGSGNDLLLGAGGNDLLFGGNGNDSLYGEDGDDQLNGQNGNDLLFGGAGSDRLDGGTGNDVLDGGTGADTMIGGDGDDTFYVDDANDVVEDTLSTGGRDVIYTSMSYTLAPGARVEVLSTDSIVGTGAINLAGNELNNEIYGNNGANMLKGGGGNDYLVGWGGDDIYYIVSGSEIIIENQNGGRDVVYTAISYALTPGSYIEALSTDSILGTAAINLTGNSFNNEIYGNNGANLLNGGGGGDYLVGWGGDDVYLIFSGAEIIVENVGGGRDVVYTAISYGLAAGTQVEVLSTDSIVGTNAINLTGNELNNEIYGNNGANLLNGGGGAGDYLVGWGGDDTYLIFTGGEIVIENAGGGRDVIYSSISYTLAAGSFVEVLSTNSIPGTGAIDLTGNELAQEVYGNNGANTLNGGAGGDYMAGFGGADSFAFTTALGSGNVDHLADFSAVDDTILLENAVFTGLANGALPASAFVAGSAAADADDRIVYNSATGQLFFDADGNGAGAQVLFATVSSGTVLTASDFMVI
jgi:Ca2+-binding RTX toxin-like protein